MKTRDEYVAKMKSELDDLNAKLSNVEAKAKEAREDARAKYHEEMAKLRVHSKAASARLDALKAAGEDTWDATVAEMEKVRDAFVHAFRYFKSQL